MAVRPDSQSTPIVGEPRQTPVVDDNVPPVSQNPRSGGGTSIVTPNPVDTVPRTPPASTTTSSGVPTTTSTAVVSGVLVDAYSSKPIVVATPNIISDAVNELAGTFGGGGGGGGGATSDEGGGMEEPKKPNYLVLGLMGLGIYYILKKLL
jgi:hypothetical protein